eukprot:scaffold6688_cov58-Phaeocystis_antarctica.AAC.4
MQPTPLLLSAEEGGRDRMCLRELGVGCPPLEVPPPFGGVSAEVGHESVVHPPLTLPRLTLAAWSAPSSRCTCIAWTAP